MVSIIYGQLHIKYNTLYLYKSLVAILQVKINKGLLVSYVRTLDSQQKYLILFSQYPISLIMNTWQPC